MHQHHAGPLVAEAYERHVLVRHRDEAGLERPRTGAGPLPEGELLVLATPGARRVPSLVPGLPALLREHLAGIDLLWLGVTGLASGTGAAQHLAEELGIEIAAPDGGLSNGPGAALYAGHGAGGTGWHRFRPDRPVSFHGARYPLPEWEAWVPAGPVALGGAVAVPVPCGLLVRSAAAGSISEVPEVTVNQRFPKIVVAVPAAAAVAELLAGFPPHPVMVVPATLGAAAHTWQRELALRLSRDIVFSAGPQFDGSTVAPGGRFRPFPTVLRQRAGGGAQQVLAVAPPPAGWERADQRSYRYLGAGGAPVVADVVPAGLVLRAEDGTPDPGAVAAPFDPAQWTLTLGATGAALSLSVLTAAEQLLAALSDDERTAVRVRLAGVPDDQAAYALNHRAAEQKSAPPPASRSFGPRDPHRPARVPSGPNSVSPSPPSPFERVDSVPARTGNRWAAAARQDMLPAVRPVPARSLAPPGTGPVARPFQSSPRSMLTPLAPLVPAGPPGPGDARAPAGPVVPSVTPVPPGARQRADSPLAPAPVALAGKDSASPRQARPATPPAAPIVTTSGAPVSTVSSGMPTSTVAGASKSPPREEDLAKPEEATLRAEPVRAEPEAAADAGQAPPAEAPERAAPRPLEEPSVAPSPKIQPVAVPVRDSSSGEQNRFVAAAGEDFGIALATVNAALATWPSMHAEDSPAGKADYVAVCLFLGRGAGAADLVNGALRTGEGAVLDGHVPCLMSGLRRLPTHRRAVLRQGQVSVSLEHRGDPGTVLTEPGFLAGSMDLDVLVPGADLDVLIWPASARRTSELMLGRPVGEAVFAAGARFKTLAVRSAAEEPEDDPDAPSAPKLAVLFRELAPGETPDPAGLDDRDRAALAKLDSVLEGRRRAALRLIEDPDAIARLTTSMVLWRGETAGAGKPVAVAS